MNGQASAEYLLVVALLAIALLLGADNPLEQLMRALGSYLQHYTYVLSRP